MPGWCVQKDAESLTRWEVVLYLKSRDFACDEFDPDGEFHRCVDGSSPFCGITVGPLLVSAVLDSHPAEGNGKGVFMGGFV